MPEQKEHSVLVQVFLREPKILEAGQVGLGLGVGAQVQKPKLGQAAGRKE